MSYPYSTEFTQLFETKSIPHTITSPKTLEEWTQALIADSRFYLTGSRYFGNTTEYSDWDFFTTYDDEMCEYLKNHWFERLPFTAYKDAQMVRVFRKKFQKEGTHIDIQLVSSSEERLAVQSLIEEFLYTMPTKLTKYQMTSLWDKMIKTLYVRDFLGMED